MRAIETFAIFDENGRMVVENAPMLKNRKVKLLILVDEEDDSDLYKLSSAGLSRAYSADEPEYDLSLITEPNSDYAAG